MTASDSRVDTDDDGRPVVPRLPDRLLDPRPVLAVGTAAWAVGLLVCLATGADGRHLALCAVGMAVGAAGWVVYALQRRAVRRGHVGAQQGLGPRGRDGSGGTGLSR